MPCYCGKTHDWTYPGALDYQSRTPERIRTEIREVPDTEIGRRPGPKRWSIREIIAHINDAEWVHGLRYRLMLVEEAPELPHLDQDRWAERFLYNEKDVGQVLDTFERLRRDNLDLLGNLEPGDLERTGRHPMRGRQVRLHDMVLHMTAHDEKHLAQIRACRGL